MSTDRYFHAQIRSSRPIYKPKAIWMNKRRNFWWFDPWDWLFTVLTKSQLDKKAFLIKSISLRKIDPFRLGSVSAHQYWCYAFFTSAQPTRFAERPGFEPTAAPCHFFRRSHAFHWLHPHAHTGDQSFLRTNCKFFGIFFLYVSRRYMRPPQRKE